MSYLAQEFLAEGHVRTFKSNQCQSIFHLFLDMKGLDTYDTKSDRNRTLG